MRGHHKSDRVPSLSIVTDIAIPKSDLGTMAGGV